MMRKKTTIEEVKKEREKGKKHIDDQSQSHGKEKRRR
jgi:hypothetical protein